MFKLKKYQLQKAMENIYMIKETLIYSTLYVQAFPPNIYQSFSFSDPQILKLTPNEHFVRIQH